MFELDDVESVVDNELVYDQGGLGHYVDRSRSTMTILVCHFNRCRYHHGALLDLPARSTVRCSSARGRLVCAWSC